MARGKHWERCDVRSAKNCKRRHDSVNYKEQGTCSMTAGRLKLPQMCLIHTDWTTCVVVASSPLPFSPNAREDGTVILLFSSGHMSIIPMSRPLMTCPTPRTNHWGCPALSERLGEDEKRQGQHRWITWHTLKGLTHTITSSLISHGFKKPGNPAYSACTCTSSRQTCSRTGTHPPAGNRRSERSPDLPSCFSAHTLLVWT